MTSRDVKKTKTAHAEWTLTDAKARFSSVFQRALDGEPQRIVRNGHQVVVMISGEAYDAAIRPKRSLVEVFSALRGADIEVDRPKDEIREVPT